MVLRCLLLVVCLCGLLPVNSQAKETVVVTLMYSSGDQRGAFNRQFQAFERENPGVKVVVREREQEYYKRTMATWLAAREPQSDVLYWFGGMKLRWFVTQGWLEPISDLWKKESFDKAFSRSARQAVSAASDIYGLPISYYQWGFYYRKSVFRRYGLVPPRTWPEFIELGERLKAQGITPVALGSSDRWPVAGWFDYLNLRINGLAFHGSLMEGKVAYTDPRVKEVFRYWRQLVDSKFFLESHGRLDWRGALPHLYRGRAGMVLMGNFIVTQLPEEVRDDIGFFRFPAIKHEIPYYEEAPIDALVIPKNAANKAGAKKLLAFLGRAEVQTEINAATGMISPNRSARLANDRFILAGAAILDEAEGIAQFYDRDTPVEMSTPGMEAFVQFLDHPERLDSLLEELEAVRRRVFRQD
jgi:multiple sugar transport system substrate-binding protein